MRDISERVRYNHKLEYLSKFCAVLSSVNTLDELYEKTFEILDKALGFKVLEILVVREGYLEEVMGSGDYKGRFIAPLEGPGVTVRAVNSGVSQLIGDVRLDPDYLIGPRNRSMLSELAVPVYVNDDVFLILNSESERVNAFNMDDKKLLEIFALYMGATIERLEHQRIINEQTELIESTTQALFQNMQT